MWLIIRVVQRWDDAPLEAIARPHGKEPNDAPLEAITMPHGSKEPSYRLVDGLLRDRGYMLAPPLASKLSLREWPLIAHVYVSPNKEGRGRSGSLLHRWIARRLPK